MSPRVFQSQSYHLLAESGDGNLPVVVLLDRGGIDRTRLFLGRPKL